MAKFGQRRAGQTAVEQRTPQLSLEPLDRVGQRGLRDAATFGRQREILIAAKSQEISGVTDLHGNRPLCRAVDAERILPVVAAERRPKSDCNQLWDQDWGEAGFIPERGNKYSGLRE